MHDGTYHYGVAYMSVDFIFYLFGPEAQEMFIVNLIIIM